MSQHRRNRRFHEASLGFGMMGGMMEEEEAVMSLFDGEELSTLAHRGEKPEKLKEYLKKVIVDDDFYNEFEDDFNDGDLK